jgi:peptide/nickel transport system substrate-binding protein
MSTHRSVTDAHEHCAHRHPRDRPAGLTFFDSFDPDSYTVIAAINDALVYVDEAGQVCPGLATAWHQRTPTILELELREGVRFHNGEPFDAECVVETFRAHREPTPTSLIKGPFALLKEVRITGPSRVEFELVAPNAMFLRALAFGMIYPKGVLRAEGRDALVRWPIGTGVQARALRSRARARPRA